jgi:hypothetical protein
MGMAASGWFPDEAEVKCARLPAAARACTNCEGRRAAAREARYLGPTHRGAMIRFSIGLVAAAFLLVATPAFSQPAAAGRIKVLSGSVFVVRGGNAQAAQAGQPVYEADSVRTGADGRVGITLKDDTRLSLGPSSEIRLDRFAYAPAEGQLAFVLNVLRGVAAYVSGRIAKLSPDAIRLETPAAIVGVRGTAIAIRVSSQ